MLMEEIDKKYKVYFEKIKKNLKMKMKAINMVINFIKNFLNILKKELKS